MRLRRGVIGWAAVAMLSVCLGARAQDASLDADAGAGESATLRAVRLTFAEGEVTIQGGEDEGAQPAQTNMPVVSGTRLATGVDGQAEVEFEDGSVVRLTPNTTLALDSLTVERDNVFATRMTLLRGLAYLELRATPQYRYTLNAGLDELVPVENTTVRVSFDQPPPAFAVLDGTAEIARQDGSMRREVPAGQSLRFDTAGAGQYELWQGIPEDTWDAWNADRDQAEAAEGRYATGVRGDYAGPQGYGWSDLDANGTWYDVPGQGQVWQPSLAVGSVGFDPYGAGSWIWYSGTGYVWASGYRWGWTPFRCGNWNYFNGFGWGWQPAGCGGFGWRFPAGGRPVNVVLGPGGYRPPHVPHPHPGPVHPILPVRMEPGSASPLALAGQTGWGEALERGPRQGVPPRDGLQINGVAANRIERGSGAALRAGTGASSARPVGSALDRDFPVDRTSRTAIVGRVSAQPSASLPAQTGSGTAQGYIGHNGYAAQGPAALYRNPPPAVRSTGPRPVYVPSQGERQRDSMTQGQRPPYTSGPQGARPSYAPPPQGPRQTYTPPPQAQRPTYSPPPQSVSRPSYTPAPQPSYTPPPHSYTPPPAPRAPAPAPVSHSPK